ncbi:MAG: Mur ligase family protein [Lachnospiraceae bacterium]
MIYEEVEEYINGIPKFTTKNNQGHTKEFLALLGNPQESFKSIHVAGSNGKGSVCAMIHRVLCKSHKKVGMFISPHLEKMVERIQIGERNCTEAEFLQADGEVRKAVEELKEKGLAHPTFFEYLFGIGMVVFRNAGVEYGVIETGLGGRLDATNVLEHPIVTVITSISLEHTEILGNTIAEIAGEKAGIIKSGTPVVFDAKNEEAAAVIEKKAREMNAYACGVTPKQREICGVDNHFIEFSCKEIFPNSRFKVPFPAEYQGENASLALYALALIQKEEGILLEEILEGLADTKWPGRMEEVSEGSYFDGAHNVAGIEEFLKTVRRIGGKKPVLLFSMVKEKNYREVIRLLTRENLWGHVIVTQISGERQIRAQKLEKVFQEYTEVSVESYVDIREAYTRAKQIKGQHKLFCTGSLYLIGELKKIQEDYHD